MHCETVEGVLKELAMFALAYNLVRSVMGESARLIRGGSRPDWADRCSALVDRNRGERPLSVGCQSVASWPGRATGKETKIQAVHTLEQATIGTTQIIADEALLDYLRGIP